eukprot:tig00021612_g22888.t1
MDELSPFKAGCVVNAAFCIANARSLASIIRYKLRQRDHLAVVKAEIETTKRDMARIFDTVRSGTSIDQIMAREARLLRPNNLIVVWTDKDFDLQVP